MTPAFRSTAFLPCLALAAGCAAGGASAPAAPVTAGAPATASPSAPASGYLVSAGSARLLLDLLPELLVEQRPLPGAGGAAAGESLGDGFPR